MNNECFNDDNRLMIFTSAWTLSNSGTHLRQPREFKYDIL